MIEIIFAAIAVTLVAKFAYDRGQNAILFWVLTLISWFIGEYLAAGLVSRNNIIYIPSLYLGGLLGATSIAIIIMSLPEKPKKN
jgi:hypothetical protein